MQKLFFALKKVFDFLLAGLKSRLTQRQFILLSAVWVGITGGLSAILLKNAVHFVHQLVTTEYTPGVFWIYVIITPATGIILCVWYIRRFHHGVYPKGIASILYAIAQRAGHIPSHHIYSQLITSSLTVGLGGSAGLESPIVKTGSAIGSHFATSNRLGYKERMLLLACGAASGIAAAFNAPIAGVLFALEVLLPDVAITALIPLLISSATGSLMAHIFMKEKVLLSFTLTQKFNPVTLPYYLIFAILCGGISLYYARIYTLTEKRFKTFTQKNIIRSGIAALILGLLFVVFPVLSGEGYDFVRCIASGQPENASRLSIIHPYLNTPEHFLLFLFLAFAVLLKPLAVGITIGCGGNGGNFAPSMFIGAGTGFLFATTINHFFHLSLPVIHFIVVGMAGALSGIFHAPLSSIFLIAEITGGYTLIIPLMIVTSVSFGIVRYFEPYSMDTRRLAEKGHIFTADKDKNILTLLKTRQFIEKNFHTVHPDMTLGELVTIISRSQRNIFPVVDKDEKLCGIILLEQIREMIFKHELYDSIRVRELMMVPPAVIDPEEDMHSVMEKFDKTGAWNLPVICQDKYAGFISKSGIFNAYREMLGKITTE